MGSLRQAGSAIFLSSADAAFAGAECPELRSITLPPLFEGSPARRRIGRAGADWLEIGMLANFDWWPNREGIQWFLREIFPHLSPEIRLHLFGRHSRRVAPDHPRILRHGFLPALEQVWSACDFMICPIISGGGVCVKFAETVYHRMPVLGTHFSARGLPLDPDPSIVLLDGAGEWIEFLNTDARCLAGRTVSDFIADRFRADRYASALSEFVSGSIREGKATG